MNCEQLPRSILRLCTGGETELRREEVESIVVVFLFLFFHIRLDLVQLLGDECKFWVGWVLCGEAVYFAFELCDLLCNETKLKCGARVVIS